MSLKAIHMLSIVRKDTAMKSFNFVCTSVRSTSIFVDTKLEGKFGKPTTRKTEIGSENSEAQKTARKAYNNYIHDIISPDQTGNPKRFWSFIKAKKQENTKILP
jgi:hypothetical protein